MTSCKAYTLSPSISTDAAFSLSRMNHSINDRNKSAKPPKKMNADYILLPCVKFFMKIIINYETV